MTNIELFFDSFSGVETNVYQKTQKEFDEDRRPSFQEGLNPEDCKFDGTLGHLKNNKNRKEEVDLQGNPMNRKIGDLFTMIAIKEATRRFNEENLQDPNSNEYMNLENIFIRKLEPLVQEIVFNADSELISNGKITTVPYPGMGNSMEALLWVLFTKQEWKNVLAGTNGFGMYFPILHKFFKPEQIIKYRQGADRMTFDDQSFEETVKKLPSPEKTLLIWQPSSYNYTGVNPNSEQNKKIINIVARTGIFPIVDSAYQGLGKGFDEDIEFARFLAKADIPFSVIDSWSKKGALYEKRISILHIRTGNNAQAEKMRKIFWAQLQNDNLADTDNWKILYYLLNDPELKNLWLTKDLPEAREIIMGTKQRLARNLGEDFRYLSPEITQGMFNALPLDPKQIKELQQEGIYVIPILDEDKGKTVARINMGSLPEEGLSYIAEKIKKVYESNQD